jgi:hypothetical protein
MGVRAEYQLKQGVQAVRWEPGTDDYKDICDWLHGLGHLVAHHDEYVRFCVDEWDVIRPGQWLIKSGDQWWVMDDEVFHETYTHPNACPIGLDESETSASFCVVGTCGMCAVMLRRECGFLRSEIAHLRRELAHHVCDPF